MQYFKGTPCRYSGNIRFLLASFIFPSVEVNPFTDEEKTMIQFIQHTSIEKISEISSQMEKFVEIIILYINILSFFLPLFLCFYVLGLLQSTLACKASPI